MVTKPSIVKHLTLKTKGDCTIKKLQQVKKSIYFSGKAVCPKWSCEQCHAMFPWAVIPNGNQKRTICPCSKYEVDYLVKRLLNIIKHFPVCAECNNTGILKTNEGSELCHCQQKDKKE